MTHQARSGRKARLVVSVAVLSLVVPGSLWQPSLLAEPPANRGTISVSGLGGTSTDFSLSGSGLRIQYPRGTTPRLAGEDGEVGGYIIERLQPRELVGGLVAVNAVGLAGALEVPLLAPDGVTLRPGRYRLSLLGNGSRASVIVTGDIRQRQFKLGTSSSPHLVSQISYGSVSGPRSWSEPLEVTDRSILILGLGTVGSRQQADIKSFCLRPEPEPPAPAACVPPESVASTVTPGAAETTSWVTSAYLPGSLDGGSLRFEGVAAGLGVQSASAHFSVVLRTAR